ncbi:hypothetical protein E2C01_011418 [Portunus trituberculatus]|uniref:Uncharacterized protein n=1 Tax=Portunus trituberculatus TaxID=210409 RepID=A0A5B7DB14_PORTR|nr:hypothetical protein [Portunus trituberculatus]
MESHLHHTNDQLLQRSTERETRENTHDKAPWLQTSTTTASRHTSSHQPHSQPSTVTWKPR